MKRLILLCSAVLALTLSGCQTYKKIEGLLNTATTTTVSASTTTEIIVDAQKTTRIAQAAFTEFLKEDKRHADLLKAHLPAVHQFAEYLREKVTFDPGYGPVLQVPRDVAVLKQLRKATDVFEANRTATGEFNLRSAIAVVKGLLLNTKTNLTQIQSLNAP